MKKDEEEKGPGLQIDDEFWNVVKVPRTSLNPFAGLRGRLLDATYPQRMNQTVGVLIGNNYKWGVFDYLTIGISRLFDNIPWETLREGLSSTNRFGEPNSLGSRFLYALACIPVVPIKIALGLGKGIFAFAGTIALIIPVEIFHIGANITSYVKRQMDSVEKFERGVDFGHGGRKPSEASNKPAEGVNQENLKAPHSGGNPAFGDSLVSGERGAQEPSVPPVVQPAQPPNNNNGPN